MRIDRGRRARPLLLALLLLALSACGSGGGDGGDDGAGGSTGPDAGPTTEAPGTTGAPGATGPDTTSPTGVPADATTVRSYFLRDEVVGPVARESADDGVGRSAMEALLAGPTDEEAAIGFSTAIPNGTELLDLAIEDGIATVDLSGPFAEGGGSSSMRGRVAQVVFTLTQFPTVGSVRFELEGKALTTLGGEGLVVEAPQTRADWEDLSPAVLVESPLPFEEVTDPVRITGTGNTFEASFFARVTDTDGVVVYEQPQMATSGTGTRGTFDVTAAIDSARPGPGTIEVYEVSESDEVEGPINVVEVPVEIVG